MQFQNFTDIYLYIVKFNQKYIIYADFFYELDFLTDLILPHKEEFLGYRSLIIYDSNIHLLPVDYIADNQKYILYSVLDSYLISHMSDNLNIDLNRLKLNMISSRLSDWTYFSKNLYRKITNT